MILHCEKQIQQSREGQAHSDAEGDHISFVNGYRH